MRRAARLRRVADLLRAPGLAVELREPDPVDPLGGVVDVEAADGDLVQLVNFFNSTRADPELGRRLGEAAVASARPLLAGVSLRVVDLPHLVALKLYSWDRRAATGKGYRDACALLDSNPGLTVAALRSVCLDVGLGPELEVLLRFRAGPTRP